MEDWQKDLQGNSDSWGSEDWGSPNWGGQNPNWGEQSPNPTQQNQTFNSHGVSESNNWQGDFPPPQHQTTQPQVGHASHQNHDEQPHQPMTDEQLVEIHNRPFLHRLGLTLVGILVVALAGFLIWKGVTFLAHKTPAEKALIEQQKVEQSLQQSIQEEPQAQTATEQTQPSEQSQTPPQTSVSEQSSSQPQEQTSVSQSSSSQGRPQTSVSEVAESNKTYYTLDQIDPQVLENTAVVKEIFFQKENDLLATFEVTFEMGSTTLTLPMNFQDVNGLGQGDKVTIKYSKVIGEDKVIIRSITR